MTKRKLKKHSETWREWLRPEDCLARFKNRIVTKLRAWHSRIRNRLRIEEEFALLAGQSARTGALQALLEELDQDFTETCIPKAIHGAKTVEELCFVIQCLFMVVRQHEERSLASLMKAVREAVEMSPGIAVEFPIQGNEIRLRPAGDGFLDKVVVDEVMLVLGRHPEVSKHFQEALRICASGETARYRNALDNLEAFAGVEIEFMIYLTGTFMRLLLDLSAKRFNTKSAPPTSKLTVSSVASTA